MFKHSLTLAAVYLAATALSGCDKEEIVQQKTSEEVKTSLANGYENVALSLAKSLGNDDKLRAFLKEEASKKFDGDYDVLYTKLVSRSASVKRKADEQLKANNATGFSSVENLLQAVPNLNISVPVNIQKWDVVSEAPLVTFIPSDFSEKTTKKLKAFDSKGNVHWLDAQNAPSFPVVVVGASERTEVDKSTNQIKVRSYLIPVCEDPNGCPEPEPTDPTPPPSGPTACRVDKRIEYLTGIWFKKLGVYEAWALGKPEITLNIKSPFKNDNSLYTGNYVEKREKMDNAWWSLNNDLFYWDQSTLSNTVVFFWNEEDGGFALPLEFNVGYTDPNTKATVGGKVSYTIKNDDDQIGAGIIQQEYCPTTGYYSLGAGDAEFRFGARGR